MNPLYLAIIRALIGWLWRHHKWLLVEAVIPSDAHIHRNPKPKKAVPVDGGSRAEGAMFPPNPATGGIDV